MHHPPRVLALLAGVILIVGFPSPTSARSNVFLLQGFPLLKQQHPLTCESSAASMGTRGRLLEWQIMATMPRHPNPNFGFRGNPDGVQRPPRFLDYGVYAAPLHKVLQAYGYRSDVISYGTDPDIVSYLQKGWPVVAWVTYALQPATPRLAQYGGIPFLLVPHEHAILIVGYGTKLVYANDPWTRTRVVYSWANFNRAWGYFGNLALAIEPCGLPQPVTGLTAVLSTNTITWNWTPVSGAAHYHVKVIRHGKTDKVLADGLLDSPSYTLGNPSSGKTYEIEVRSVSSCGSESDPVRLLVIANLQPAPTVTPTSTEGSVGTGTATPTRTATATPTASATATATPTATSTP